MSKDHFAFLNNLTNDERTILEDGLEIHHYAIFNNGIDHNLLEHIADDNKNLTDKLFFELLSAEPAYLATVQFQKKINKWRELCLWPELHQKKEVAAARSNLRTIGHVLGRSGLGAGAPERFSHTDIRNEYTNTIKFLKNHFTAAGEKPSSKLLIKAYPEWKKAFQDEAGRRQHRSIKEIALRLTLYRFTLREHPLKMTLKTLRKKIK